MNNTTKKPGRLTLTLLVSAMCSAMLISSTSFAKETKTFKTTAVPAAPATVYATPQFKDDARSARVAEVLPELDKLYADLASAEHIPGLVYGVVLDGKLIHTRSIGFANLEMKLPVTGASQFRIASMTKSFVAMAALKLRDDGKLKLDDPVTKYLPEFREVRLPTQDSPAITIRQLMTMTTGLPEDNPWGDRQMALTNDALARFVKGGLSFSNAPEHGFEYSNLGFVMLGKIISRVAGVRYQDYITRTIFLPLGMKNTLWEYSQAPVENFALGYRWEHEQWKLEPILHDGDAAAMGGLITTMDDFSKYLAFHLSAWPARDGVEDGPVKRSTVREMQQPSVYAGTSSKTTMVDGITPNQKISFYAKGLIWGRDSYDVVQVGHSGGLPGYGSQFRFAPEHGVGVVAFSNLRYGPVYAPTSKALNILIERAKLPMRTIMPSPVLLQRAAQVLELLKDWNETLAASIVADNFFLDRSRADWMAYASKEFAAIGTIKSMSKIKAENQLRGSFTISGQQGDLEIAFTLTPERIPKMQELKIKRLPVSK